MQTPRDTYLADSTYHALKEALARTVSVPPDRFGCDADSYVVETLGEVGGIWPESVLADRESA